MNYKKTVKIFEEYGEKETRKLKDLKGIFRERISDDGNKKVYETYTKKFSPINLTLTEIEPGNVNGEFFLTKGHIHKNRTPEFYVLLEGKGLLLLQKGNKIKEIKLKIGKINLISEGYAHRLINQGNTKLKVLTIYHENSKPNYNVKFKRRFFKK